MTKQTEADPVDGVLTMLRDPATPVEKLESGRLIIAEKMREVERLLEELPAKREELLNATSPIAMRTAKLAELKATQEAAAPLLELFQSTFAQLDAAIARRREDDEKGARRVKRQAAEADRDRGAAQCPGEVAKAHSIIAELIARYEPVQAAVDAANADLPAGAAEIMPIDFGRWAAPPPPPKETGEETETMWVNSAGHRVSYSFLSSWEDDTCAALPTGYHIMGDSGLPFRRITRRFRTWMSFSPLPAPRRSALTILREIGVLFDELQDRPDHPFERHSELIDERIPPAPPSIAVAPPTRPVETDYLTRAAAE